MIRISAILLVSLMTTPAFANPVQINRGGDPAQAQVYGNGSAASASRSTATAHQSQHQTQGQHQTASGGTASATGGSVSLLTTSGGSQAATRAPDVVLPGVGGGGMDCPTVGFGAGGSGLGGGGGFGPSWISSDCNKRKVAAELAAVYGVGVARAYMEREIPGVKEAVAAAGANEHQSYPFDWCATRNAGDRNQHLECGR